MMLKDATNFSENSNSIIYTMNSPQTGQYAIVVPKDVDSGLSMVVDVNMKSSFDSMIGNSMSKDDLVGSIFDKYNLVKTKYSGGILVMPMLDKTSLDNAVNSGDKQKMFDEVKKIGSITSEIFRKIVESGIDKSSISQKIVMLENNDIDTKFVEWLKEQMPNFVDGVSISSLSPKEKETVNSNVNPFDGVDFFENSDSLKEEDVSKKSGGIFDDIPPVIQEQSSSDIVDNQTNDVTPPRPIEKASIDSNPFGNVSPDINSEPLPSVEPVKDEDNGTNIDKKSGGFANLLILVVILVVVTIISIEFGKFLYGMFGT